MWPEEPIFSRTSGRYVRLVETARIIGAIEMDNRAKADAQQAIMAFMRFDRLA
jgi:hypothetical protein